jgi:hypothetical protein
MLTARDGVTVTRSSAPTPPRHWARVDGRAGRGRATSGAQALATAVSASSGRCPPGSRRAVADAAREGLLPGRNDALSVGALVGFAGAALALRSSASGTSSASIEIEPEPGLETVPLRPGRAADWGFFEASSAPLA